MKKFKNIPNQSYRIDDKIFWDSRSVAVNCFIFVKYNDNNYVLIEQRGLGAADNIGKWVSPCGYLDFQETGTEAVTREVWEETGFDLDSIKNLIVSFLDQPWFVNTNPSANRQNVSLRYGIYFESDTLLPLTDKYSEPNEIIDLKWVKIEDIGQYDFAYNHDKIILEFENLLIEKGYIQ